MHRRGFRAGTQQRPRPHAGISFRPTGNHSNALVPLWAKGAGAELLGQRVRGVDAGYRQHVRWNDGSYIDNTDVAAAVQEALQRPR
jgi:alkaline phosphatase